MLCSWFCLHLGTLGVCAWVAAASVCRRAVQMASVVVVYVCWLTWGLIWSACCILCLLCREGVEAPLYSWSTSTTQKCQKVQQCKVRSCGEGPKFDDCSHHCAGKSASDLLPRGGDPQYNRSRSLAAGACDAVYARYIW